MVLLAAIGLLLLVTGAGLIVYVIDLDLLTPGLMPLVICGGLSLIALGGVHLVLALMIARARVETPD
ncbi:hypothetical protein ACLBXM_14010 [Xanthobacteraceae bacterium A53D]